VSSLEFVLLGALAVIVGALIPVQAATNASMSRAIGSVAITSLALFATGFVVVAARTIVMREPLPSLETLRHVPAYVGVGHKTASRRLRVQIVSAQFQRRNY
jgi:transporter family-2 protein